MIRTLPRPRYADVVATLALLVALGGTSYAAAKIGSAEIRNNSIRSKDVRNGSLTLTDLKDSSEALLRSQVLESARVREDGSIDPADPLSAGSVGLGDNPAKYCFYGLEKTLGGRPPANALVTPIGMAYVTGIRLFPGGTTSTPECPAATPTNRLWAIIDLNTPRPFTVWFSS